MSYLMETLVMEHRRNRYSSFYAICSHVLSPATSKNDVLKFLSVNIIFRIEHTPPADHDGRGHGIPSKSRLATIAMAGGDPSAPEPK
jgi:hypothetical protein